MHEAIISGRFGPRCARAADPIFGKAAGSGLGCAASTDGDVMSGAGAGVDVRVCIVSGRQGFGRPERSLVTIGGGPGVRVASATNSNATSAKPTTAKKVRAGIATFPLRAPQHLGNSKAGRRDRSSWTINLRTTFCLHETQHIGDVRLSRLADIGF
jgi:hypothetical protein